jgi:hypothetical protein
MELGAATQRVEINIAARIVRCALLHRSFAILVHLIMSATATTANPAKYRCCTSCSATARSPLRNDPATTSSCGRAPWPSLIFDVVVIYGHRAVVRIPTQRRPAFEAVIQGFSNSETFTHKFALGDHLGMKFVYPGRRVVGCSVPNPSFRVQLHIRLRCTVVLARFCRWCAVVKITPSVGHAANFGDPRTKLTL